MDKCIEIQWSITPFRSQKFVDAWTPYAELAIDFGATSHALIRSLDDELIVRQFAFFESKEDWNRYWNSPKLSEGRQKVLGMHVVPVVYGWHEVVAAGAVSSV